MRSRFQVPDLEVPAPIPWEWFDHPKYGRRVKFWTGIHDRWTYLAPWTGTFMDALQGGESFQAAVDAAAPEGVFRSPRQARRRMGTFLYSLWSEGYVSMPLDPPESFPPDHEIKKELGRGGVGVAWLCRAPSGEDVVVKHAWDFFVKPDQAERIMEEEDEMLQRLDGDGVVRRLASFRRGDHLYLVREYLDGVDVLASGRANPEARIRIAQEVHSILLRLHERGVALVDHRPSNFFVSSGPEGRVVLADVGGCRDLTVEAGQRVAGTPGFSAPELRQGHVSPAVDAYGYGALLFALAKGHGPLPQWGQEQIMQELQDHPWQAVIGALVDADPTKRTQLADVALPALP